MKCPKDSAAPTEAVRRAYARLVAAHAVHRDRREVAIEAALSEVLDGRTFAIRALTDKVLSMVQPSHQERWIRTLGGLLHRKIRARLQRPGRFTLSSRKVEIWCTDARVAAVLSRRVGRADPKSLVFRLSYRARRWRVYDVSVEGSGLLASWRRRLAWAFREGGVSRISAELVKIRDATKKKPGT